MMPDLVELDTLALCALGYEEVEAEEMLNDDLDIASMVHDRWGIDMDTFANLSLSLLKLTVVAQSPLTKKWHHIFTSDQQAAIVKMEPAPAKLKKWLK